MIGPAEVRRSKLSVGILYRVGREPLHGGMKPTRCEGLRWLARILLATCSLVRADHSTQQKPAGHSGGRGGDRRMSLVQKAPRCSGSRGPDTKIPAIAAGLALAATLGFSEPGSASVVTHTYSFMASDFLPAGAPTDPVIGSFTLSFDPTGPDVTESQVGIHLNSINIQFSGLDISYNYLSGPQDLVVGGIQDGTDQFQSGTNDFVMEFFVDDAGDPVIDASHDAVFAYSQIGLRDDFATSAVGVTVTEPGTFGLMAALLPCLFAGRRYLVFSGK